MKNLTPEEKQQLIAEHYKAIIELLGEDPEREGVAVRLVHEFKILIDDFRMFEPLVGIPVASVENVREIFYDRHVLFLFV